jgi:hypothetical protein
MKSAFDIWLTRISAIAGIFLTVLSMYIAYQLEADRTKQEDRMQKEKNLMDARRDKIQCISVTMQALNSLSIEKNSREKIILSNFLADINAACISFGNNMRPIIENYVLRNMKDIDKNNVNYTIDRVRKIESEFVEKFRKLDEEDREKIVLESRNDLSDIGDLVDVSVYGGGAFLSGTGLLNFKKHVDTPSQNPLRKPVGPETANGTGLLAFPSVTELLNDNVSRLPTPSDD